MKDQAQSFVLADQHQTEALEKLLLVDMKTVVDESGSQIKELGDYYEQQIAHESQVAESQYSRSRLVVLVFLIVAALAPDGLALWLTRSISGPPGAALSPAETVASGDLTHDLRIVGN